MIDSGKHDKQMYILLDTLKKYNLFNQVFFSETYSGSVGLIITQAISMTGMLQWGIRQTLELENHMISVERILEYTNVPQEAAFESSLGK